MKQMKKLPQHVVLGLSLIGVISLMTGVLAGHCWAETIQTVAPGKLIVSLNNAWPPFQFIDEKGTPIGFDADLAVEIGKRLGLQTELVSEEWTKAQNLVKQGKADLLFGCSPSAERALVFDRKEYSYSIYGMMTLESNPYVKIEDVFGKKVGKQKGAKSDTFDQKYAPKFRMPEYAGLDQLLEALVKQEIDAAVADAVPFYYTANKTQIKLKTIWEERETLGFLVKKGNLPLVEKIAAAMISIQQDGAWDNLNEKWFGQEDVAPKFEEQ